MMCALNDGFSSWGTDVEIVVQPGSLAARNYLSWQKYLADLRLIIRLNLDDFRHFWTNFGQFWTDF